MPTIKVALEVFDKFIGIGKELAKLPALVLPQYQMAAVDLYKISQKLLASNENLSKWLHKFLYFDFKEAGAGGRFLALLTEYRSMKSGPQLQQLKFSCGDISAIYHRDIASKLGRWFSDQSKLEEVEGMFETLANADSDMLAFTYDNVLARLDDFVAKTEKSLERGSADEAEETRLRFKSEMRDVVERLEWFGGEIADLVLRFAAAARVPVTLAS